MAKIIARIKEKTLLEHVRSFGEEQPPHDTLIIPEGGAEIVRGSVVEEDNKKYVIVDASVGIVYPVIRLRPIKQCQIVSPDGSETFAFFSEVPYSVKEIVTSGKTLYRIRDRQEKTYYIDVIGITPSLENARTNPTKTN